MKVVFTNGCFDIIHAAHVSLLEYCASLGDRVIVGLNSDASVKRLKGPNRPINNEHDRKYILQSIRYVDNVIIFDEDTPYELIKCVTPDIIVKGGDYKPDNVVGSDLCSIVIFPYDIRYSTTKTIQSASHR